MKKNSANTNNKRINNKKDVGDGRLTSDKGITLIALVITIIILLILATIVINLTIGKRGILNRAEEAKRDYAKSAEEEEKQLGDLLDIIDEKGSLGNEDKTENQLPVYARLYTVNGSTDEVLMLASKEEVFLDYSSELTLKDDFGNIYEKYYKTEEDLYELPEYAEYLQLDEWKEYKTQNPEDAQRVIELMLEEANFVERRPWIRYEESVPGDWYYMNRELVEVRILDEIFPTSTRGWFERCSRLKNIVNIKNLNTSKVTNMKAMFVDCRNLSTLDLSSFNTSNVTDMSEMFKWSNGLITLDLSNFNTLKVTNMSEMFSGCDKLTTLNLSNFNTSKVTNMSEMFYDCNRLTQLDISDFDTSKVADMSRMFYLCGGLTKIIVGENWIYADGVNKTRMFTGCGVSDVTYVTE